MRTHKSQTLTFTSIHISYLTLQSVCPQNNFDIVKDQHQIDLRDAHTNPREHSGMQTLRGLRYLSQIHSHSHAIEALGYLIST